MVKLTNVDIIGFKTAISIPHNGELEYNCGRIAGTEFGIVQRDPPAFFAQLGLPNDTPYDALLVALLLLRDNRDANTERKVKILESSKFGPYLQNSSNIVATVSGLTALSSSPMGAQVIAWLQSL